ncbi:MAG TPA: potassium channel family protein [Aliidongia sp.]|nr:potassium channel family protein [Aliidongia sp.]
MTDISPLLATLFGRRVAQTVSRRRDATLLAALVLLVLATPIADVAPRAQLVIAAATVAFLLACLQQADARSGLRVPARLLVVFWLILKLPFPWVDGTWVAAAAAAVLAILTLGVIWLVARRLAHADRVDSELLCGAIGAYLLLGVFWAGTYEIISAAAPAAFAGPGGAVPNRSALLYFSFTTLTTTGYGDITAVNPVARMWTIFEAIIGTVYNATVVARLVSLYGARAR